jgi:hypothetical protein
MRRCLRPTLLLVVLSVTWTGTAGASTGGISPGGAGAGAPTTSTATGGGASADGKLSSTNTPKATKPEGGAQYGAKLRRARVTRPRVSILRVATPIQAGSSIPRISLRIDESTVRSVRARVVVLALPSNRPVATIQLGQISTGRTHGVHWPRSVRLGAGQYLVRVHARDRFNHVLERLAHTSGRATLVVTPAPAPAAPTPAPPAPPIVGSVLPGGIFPVQGPHTYGDGVGAARNGHTHQGQDVAAASGTPVVAPVAGPITVTSYQAAAAGYYVVEQANDGRSFFFAHCQKGSFGTEAGNTVAAGGPICRVGSTGDATGPHLHFEEWLGGWRVDSRSRFVDPLAQLKAWDRGR